MSDRELLEFAAKAAGIGGGWQFVRGRDTPIFYRDVGGRVWNPITDDGDALRLAVKLRIDVHYDHFVVVAERVFPQEVGVAKAFDGDPLAATRRAIVRAAAEIGRQMP